MTRILHITGRSDHGGGPEHLLQILLSEENDCDSFVACPMNGVYWGRYRQRLGEQRLFPIPHRRISLRWLLRLAQYVRANGIRIIHSHGMSGGIYGRLLSSICRVPCVHTFHGLPRTLNLKHSLYYYAELLLARFTRLGVAVSQGESRLIRHRYPMYTGRLAIVENGIAESDGEVSGDSARMRALAAPKRTIVSFTRLNRQKNPWLIIEIAEELRRRGELGDLQFHLYGEDVSSRRFRDHVARAGLDQTIKLFPPTDDPGAVLANAFCYLSTSRWEGMPLSLLEAHREGICVIASKVIGNRDVIANGHNGLLYPEGDARAAADCLVKLKHDRALRVALRVRGANHCRTRHNRDLMVSKLQRIYRLVTSAGPVAQSVPADLVSAPVVVIRDLARDGTAAGSGWPPGHDLAIDLGPLDPPSGIGDVQPQSRTADVSPFSG